MVSDIEPVFAASAVLHGMLSVDSEEGERNTLLSKRFPGGSLKIVAARAPRNLRRHTARILLVDEADACETGIEGNPIRLAERRTLSFANRRRASRSCPAMTSFKPRIPHPGYLSGVVKRRIGRNGSLLPGVHLT
jgi:phage terminase large subunit GpA-like protein